MTAPQSTTTAAPSFGRDTFNTARRNLGNRWAPVVFAGLAIVIGLYFGGWAWLVAIGAAPIILSTLPCLVMCGLGVCGMCAFGKRASASSPVATDATAMVSPPETAKVDAPALTVASCCQGAIVETPAYPIVSDSTEETHA